MKKNFDYFAALQSQSDLACQALTLLLGARDLFNVPGIWNQLHHLARESTTQRRAITDAALEDFLPPMDRGDLLDISAGYCGVIWQSMEALRHGTAADLAAMAEALQACAPLLPHMKKNAAALLALIWNVDDLSHPLEDLSSPAAMKPCFSACAVLAAALERALVKNI